MSDRRRPHRFDPGQRSRDFTRERRRKGRKRRSTERRVEALETWSYLTTSVASQPPGNSLIEVVDVLPEPSYLDIGRQIILRSPDAEQDILYVGMQMPDDTVAWVQWTSSYEDEIPGSPDIVFDRNVTIAGLTGPNGVMALPCEIMYSVDGDYVREYHRIDCGGTSAGTTNIAVTGVPAVGQTGQGVFATGPNPGDSLWAASPSGNSIYYWDGSLPINTAPSSRDYWGLCNDPVSGALFATGFAEGDCFKINKTTLAIISTFATDCSGPQGIATDSTGRVFVADTGNNRIRRYSAALGHQLNFGTLGAGEGQFNAPKGIFIDGSDRLYVADSGNNRIQIFDTDGNFLEKFGNFGAGEGQFSNPVDVSVSGTLIDVADRGNLRVSCWYRV